MAGPLAARPIAGRGMLALAIVLLCAWSLAPLMIMLTGALQTPASLFSNRFLPTEFTLANFVELFTKTDFLRWAFNSTLVALGSTAITVVASVLAGYSLANFRFRGRLVFTRTVLFVYMFPSLALSVPLYIVFRSAGLTNHPFGLMLAHASAALPFGIWLLAQAFQPISSAYRESAYWMGAGSIRTMVQIELPLVMPAVATVGIFAFSNSWENYTYSFILTTQQSAQTLPVALTRFMEGEVIHWGLMEAAGVWMLVPPMLIAIFFGRYFVAGIGLGGVKG